MDGLKIVDEKVNRFLFIQDIKSIHPAILDKLKEKSGDSNNIVLKDIRRRGGIRLTQNEINEKVCSKKIY